MSLTAYLGLGANLGDRRAALQEAVRALGASGVRVLASSSIYETTPVGLVLDQPDFLNAALEVMTDLEPEALLDAVKAIEHDAGRRAGPRHGPRPLDIDLLVLEGREHRSERLQVPHAALLERRFALVPLLELDLGLALPDGTGLADALAVLPFDEEVRRAGPPLTVA